MSSAAFRQAGSDADSSPETELLAESLADLFHRSPELEEALDKHWYGQDQQPPHVSFDVTVPSIIEDLTGESVTETVTTATLTEKIAEYNPTPQQTEGVHEALRYLQREITGLYYRIQTDSTINPSQVLIGTIHDLVHSITIAKYAFTTMTTESTTPITFETICTDCGHNIKIKTEGEDPPEYCPYCGEEYGGAGIARLDTFE